MDVNRALVTRGARAGRAGRAAETLRARPRKLEERVAILGGGFFCCCCDGKRGDWKRVRKRRKL